MNYFIDTNIIIDLLANKIEAKKLLKSLIEDGNSELFINRLVLTETLRTIHFEHTKVFKEAEEKLALFTQLNIQPQIYEKAITFSRYCHSKGIKLKGKCEAIDFLHFMTAKYYGLTLISNDKDLEKLEKAYESFLNG